jgi:hypothetical protein
MNEAINKSTNDEISLKEIFDKVGSFVTYLISKWWKIVLFALIGAFIAGIYAYTRPIKYTAEMSFVVEEGRTSGGGLASLVGQFGLDVSGASGATLFSGDNILMFLKSSSLTKETLLTPYIQGNTFSLADKYAEVAGLKEKWKASSKIAQDVFFPTNSKVFSRLQDSLLNTITSSILKKELIVDRPEKKSTFIVVTATLGDEKLATLFCERLVQKATDRYVFSKTNRQKNNVDRLARRADSIESVLNGRTFTSAIAQEEILDLNPASRKETVNAEVKNRDKLMLTQIYGEVIKNLEISKMQLSQETPTIQIVDTPSLPLPKTKIQLILFGLVGAIVFSLLSIFFFIIKKLLQ